MTKFRQKLSGNSNAQKLLFLAWFLIPFIPIALLWGLLNPVDFWQSVIMLFVCIVCYVGCLFVEIVLAILISEM